MHRIRKLTLKDLVGGNKASVELLLVSLVVLALGTFSLLAKKSIEYHQEIKERQKTYLCLKQTFDNYYEFQKLIKKTNIALIALNTTLAITQAPPIIAAIKAVKYSQEAINAYSIMALTKNKSCNFIQKIYLYKFHPARGKSPILKRGIGGVVLFKRKSSKLHLYSSTPLQSKFIIKANVHYEPRFHILKSSEIKRRLF